MFVAGCWSLAGSQGTTMVTPHEIPVFIYLCVLQGDQRLWCFWLVLLIGASVGASAWGLKRMSCASLACEMIGLNAQLLTRVMCSLMIVMRVGILFLIDDV